MYQASQPHYNEWPEKFPPLQKSILDGLTGSGAKLVLIENIYMYGAMNSRASKTRRIERTAQGSCPGRNSNAALLRTTSGRLRVTAARGGNFFGPWGTDSTMGARVFYPLLHGKPAQLIRRSDLPHTHTYVKDFAERLSFWASGKKPMDMPGMCPTTSPK